MSGGVMDEKLAAAFLALAELAMARKEHPLNRIEGACWEVSFPSTLGDGRNTWRAAINGHKVPVACSFREGSPLAPFVAYVTYNGWPAAEFSVYGGTFVAGEGANEDVFLASVLWALTIARNGEAA